MSAKGAALNQKHLLKCRTFGARHRQQSNPGLTAGPIACRPFGPDAIILKNRKEK
jgi:hypothetical protein